MSDVYHKLYDDFLWALKKSCLKYGDFELSSGKKTGWLLDCKKITLDIYIFDLMGELFQSFIHKNNINTFCSGFNCVAGVPMGGVPIAMSICNALKSELIHLVFIRNERKKYGSKSLVECSERLERRKQKYVVVVEDVITTGASVIKTVNTLKQEGFNVLGVFCILDRSYDKKKEIEDKIGCKIYSLYLPEHFGK